jgi:chaperonin cofactor prefoldin
MDQAELLKEQIQSMELSDEFKTLLLAWVEALERQNEHLDARTAELDRQIAALDGRIESLDRKLERELN